MNNEEKIPKTQNETKHELANAWSMYFWQDLDRRLDNAIGD